MQGLYKALDKYSKRVIGLYFIDDIEKFELDIEEGIYQTRGLERFGKANRLEFEVLYKGDDVEEKMLEYILPISRRLKYDDSIKNYVLKNKNREFICSAIDNIIIKYPNLQYSFYFKMDENNDLCVVLYKDGIQKENIKFTKEAVPYSI